MWKTGNHGNYDLYNDQNAECSIHFSSFVNIFTDINFPTFSKITLLKKNQACVVNFRQVLKANI